MDERTTMNKIIVSIFLVSLIIISACDNDQSSIIGPVASQDTLAIPPDSVSDADYVNKIIDHPGDSLVKEYINGTPILKDYVHGDNPLIRIDSFEVRDVNPPHWINEGKIYIYYKDALYDSLGYIGNYHAPGLCKPPLQGGFLDRNNYILRVKRENGDFAYEGKSFWYQINNQKMFRLPEVNEASLNGLYQSGTMVTANVKRFGDHVVFYGYYYYSRNVFTSYNTVTGIFRNYSRTAYFVGGERFFTWDN